MAIPIPRISWGDDWPVVIADGVNDRFPVSVAVVGYERSGYVGKVAAGSYPTPEYLAAAINAAVGTQPVGGEGGSQLFKDVATISGDANAGSYMALSIGPIEGVGLGPWSAGQSVAAGAVPIATSNGRLYRVAASGVTGGVEPTSEVNPVADGTATLAFIGRQRGATVWFNSPPAWIANGYIHAGDLVATPEGRMYVCEGAGVTGATAPTGEGASETDGAATMRYAGRVEAARGLGDLLGFGSVDVSTDLPSGQTFIGVTLTASSPLDLWSPDVPVRADVEREFESVVTQVETAGGQNKTTRWTPESLSGRRTYRRVRFAYLKPERVFTDVGGAVALETFWRSGSIGRFTYAPDRDNPTINARDYFLRESSARAFKPRRMFDGVELYEIELEMGLFTE